VLEPAFRDQGPRVGGSADLCRPFRLAHATPRWLMTHPRDVAMRREHTEYRPVHRAAGKARCEE
jgi:hypothetical protein